MGWSDVLEVAGQAVRAELLLWVPLSSGLPDRYRIPFTAVFLVVTGGALVVLAYTIRTTDPEPVEDRNITAKLERPDLLEGGDPANTLERMIQVASRPSTYGVLFTVLAGLMLAGFVVGGVFESAVMVLVYAGGLLLLQAFLRFGWPHVETFYGRREPEERDPDSLRFQGFSTDTLVFLTLVAAMVVGTLGLVALQTVVG